MINKKNTRGHTLSIKNGREKNDIAVFHFVNLSFFFLKKCAYPVLRFIFLLTFWTKNE